jgi:hypothetical protein
MKIQKDLQGVYTKGVMDMLDYIGDGMNWEEHWKMMILENFKKYSINFKDK